MHCKCWLYIDSHTAITKALIMPLFGVVVASIRESFLINIKSKQWWTKNRVYVLWYIYNQCQQTLQANTNWLGLCYMQCFVERLIQVLACTPAWGLLLFLISNREIQSRKHNKIQDIYMTFYTELHDHTIHSNGHILLAFTTACHAHTYYIIYLICRDHYSMLDK